MEADPRRPSDAYVSHFAAGVQSIHTDDSTASLRDRGAAPGVSPDENNSHPQADPFAGPVGIAISDPAIIGDISRAQTPDEESLEADASAELGSSVSLPLYKRRWFRFTSLIATLLAIVFLFVILFPVLKAIIQYVINKSYLNVTTAMIINPSNSSFNLGIEGTVSHTGIFSAIIKFTQPVNVSWIQGSTKTPLGYMTLAALYTANKRATIHDITTFHIDDQDAFGRFTAYMITSQNFTWQLESNHLSVRAAKFPWAHGISFNKVVTINGANNFAGHVLLQDLQLPSDNPGGGIDFVAITQLTNPSPFALGLGTVIFTLSYQGVYLGRGTSTNTQLVPGNNNITLKGALVPQTTPSDLVAVSQLFTNYINFETSPVIATGQSTLQPDGSTISWLSQALQSLQLTVPFKSASPIKPIQSISIGDMALIFTPETAWMPRTDSNSVQASMKLPFGFGLSISDIQNQFMIVKNGMNVAALTTPSGASTSSIRVLGPTDTEGTIDIRIANGTLNSTAEQHPNFAAFNTDLTVSKATEFLLVGGSRAVANTSIGQITLDPIKVNVSTSLNGLQGLKGYITIESVDVLGGTEEALELGIAVFIYNPSNLQLATGDLQLQLQRGGTILGTSLLLNLTLVMGNNSLSSTAYFEPNNSPQGLETLNEFVGGKDVEIAIVGYDNSTQVQSLLPAFESLNITTTLPGLKSSLLLSGALMILPTTFHENNISQVTVTLSNPFTAGFDITEIISTVTSHGLRLGSINTITSFTAAGKMATASPPLDFAMTSDPPTLFTLARVLAVEAGLDPTPLDGIVQLGGYTYVPTTSADLTPVTRRANTYTGFDLPKFVDKAFTQLRADVQLSAGLTIGEYATRLTYTQLDIPIATDSTLNLILPVLAKPIVQNIVGGSMFGIHTVLISNPQQASFDTQLKGSITNTGPFDATISFRDGLTVSWDGQLLGLIKMGDISIIGDVGATLEVQTTFEVADVNHLGAFTKVLLNNETFTWDISGEDLIVTALGVVVEGITLPTKSITLKGFDGLKDGVKITSFDLPANDPAGGIHLTIQSEVANPSQVGIELSSIAFTTLANGFDIATVASLSSVMLSPLSTSSLPLAGRLLPQSSAEALAAVSAVFNNFIHGMDSNVTVVGESAGPSDVTWLNEGIQTLQVATSLPNQGKINIIKTISLGQLELIFTQDTAYGPMASSNATTAAFTLPFGFPVDIVSLEQNITVGYGGQSIAELAIPNGPCTTDVQARVIHMTFTDVPFAVFSDKHMAFQTFLAATTMGGEEALALSGAANVATSTAVGVLSLMDIEFAVQSTIDGLQGLTERPVTVANLDVVHGYLQYLSIKLDTFLYDPSNLTIGTGDVSFTLQFEDEEIGSADLRNLVIQPGEVDYPTDVLYSPHGSAAAAAGQTMLENYLQGINSSTTIFGTTASTPINSLKLAMSEIRLSPVIIPALHQNLIPAASLIFPTNVVQTGVASTTFTLANPFTASINLLQLTATATFHNLTVGAIQHVDRSSDPVVAPGHANVTSPSLPFKINLDPVTIIELISDSAQVHGVDLGPLVELFQMVLSFPSYHPPVNVSVDIDNPTCVSGNQFDIEDAILKALEGLQVDLQINSSVALDEYAIDLAFVQQQVTVNTDRTVLYLIGAVAAPIAQELVSGADLTFTQAKITSISEEGFNLDLQGSLTNVGPLDALIEFIEPVTVTWEGHDIATISLPSVCAAANTGVPNYHTQGKLVISDQAQFTSFATYLLHSSSFEWAISTSKLRVTALGTIFDNISLKKTISLKAFNNLPGVIISNFQMPADDSAGGITISTDSLIPSASQLGIDLGTVGFRAYFEDVLVGPLMASDLILAPESQVTTHLVGRIVPQSGQSLSVVGKLFSEYLAAGNITLSVKGESVQPPGATAPVAWLSTAFQTLTLDVALPGHKFDIIQSIALSDLSVKMENQDEAFAPLAGSKNALAEYKNPFGFSLQVIQSAVDMMLALGGVPAAELNLPLSDSVGGVSTGNVVPLPISFHDVPLRALNDAMFEAMFAQVTDRDLAVFGLSGTANVTAKTAIGDIPISGIPFAVTSSLRGINSFGGTTAIHNVSINGSGGSGGNQYIISPLTSNLHNPANISLSTIDIALPVYYKNVLIGRAAFDPFDLAPGDNAMSGEFRYEPADANDTVAQGFLTSFVQSGDVLPLIVKGDGESSPFASLQPALEGITLTTSVTGLKSPSIITHIYATLSLDTLASNEIQVSFDIYNPLEADLVLEFVQADGMVNGEIYAHFVQSFSNFVIPPGHTVNSGMFGHVKLVKGAMASLQIIPLGYLDVQTANTIRVGTGGYQVPWLHINQMHVPTTYNYNGISLADLMSTVQSLTAVHISTLLPLPTSLALPSVPSLDLPTGSLGVLTTKLPSLPTSLPSGLGKALPTQVSPDDLIKNAGLPVAI